MCHSSSACYIYILWADLDHSHFGYGKCKLPLEMDTKIKKKRNCALWFLFSIQCSDSRASNVGKVTILYT